MRFVNLNNHTK